MGEAEAPRVNRRGRRASIVVFIEKEERRRG
jgi:hypothetical protein